MRGTMKKVLAGLVLFGSGLVVGFFGTRLLAERGTLAVLHGDPTHFAEMALHHLSVDLDLTPEQIGKIRPIMMETAKKLAEIRREQEPKIQKALDNDISSIKKILDADQRVRFEAVLDRLKKRRESMDRFGPRHMPPPPPDMGPPPGAFDGPPPPPGDMPPPPPAMEPDDTGRDPI